MPPVWLITPVEFTAVAVFNRAEVVNVPFAMLNTPIAPDTVPTWLSCGTPLTVVVVSTGASSSSPNVNDPLFTANTQGTVIGVDAKPPLDWARKLLGDGVAVQGNLDNLLLDAPRELLAARVKDVLKRGGPRGHIFNLGHGILPETNPDAVKFVTDLVHEHTAARL